LPLRSYRDFVIYTDYIHGAPFDARGRPSAYSVRVFDSPGGEGEHGETVEVRDWDQIQAWQSQLASRQITPEQLKQFAKRLGALMMPPYAADLYHSSLARLQDESDGLRIRLRLLQELVVLPWEYALIQMTGGEPTPVDFLALNPRISIVRHQPIAIPAVPFRSGERHRLIVAMASPKPYTTYRKLDLKKEQQEIKAALKLVPGIDALYRPDYDKEPGKLGVTEDEVKQALGQPVDVFHFSGHGEFRTDLGPRLHTVEGQGEIVLAGEDGSAHPVSADKLCVLLAEGGVRLAVLDACETAESDIFRTWGSVAAGLLKGGIPAVVAMQFSVYDDLARRFAQAFYQNIVAGRTLDEAVAQARHEMWRHGEGDRDWGAPVLYMRNSGGCILPPVRDEVARSQAETASEQSAALYDALLEWTRQGALANAAQLQLLESAGDTLQPTIPDVLLLLRSALACGAETVPWVAGLRRLDGDWIGELDAPEPLLQSAAWREGKKLLGLGEPALGALPSGTGAVTWSAVRHPDPLTRQTACLALLVLGPAEALRRLHDALVIGAEDAGQRRNRRAELYGVLAETDAETAAQVGKQLDNLQDRFVVWRWRAGRIIRHNWVRIGAWSIRGALGAAVALAAYRALLAIPDNGVGGNASIAFAIYSYWGFMLGLALTFGMVMAGPLLLQNPRRPEPNKQRAAAALAVLLGALAFGAANIVVALFNGASFGTSIATFPSALLVGVGLGLGLYNQPRAGWRLGAGGWLRRLVPAFALSALSQLPALCEAALTASKQWLGMSAFTESNWLIYGFSWIPALKTLFDRCDPFNLEVRMCCYGCGSAGAGGTVGSLFTNCFEQWLTIIDAGIVGLVLTIGITAALHISKSALRRRWLALKETRGSTLH